MRSTRPRRLIRIRAPSHRGGSMSRTTRRRTRSTQRRSPSGRRKPRHGRTNRRASPSRLPSGKRKTLTARSVRDGGSAGPSSDKTNSPHLPASGVMKNFLLQFFTWWNGQTLGTRWFTWRKGEFVGTDETGNRYYRDKAGARRSVLYKGVAEPSAIPP